MNIIREIRSWFEKAVPHPTAENKATQVACNYEETGEMARALWDWDEAEVLEELSERYKTDTEYIYAADNLYEDDKINLLDALCDQIVTAVGVAHMFGFDLEAALREVNRSNWSKFDEDGNPLFDSKGKIAKGPNYTRPDLADYI